jgi:hypothetical protein
MNPTPLSRPQIGTRYAFVGHLELEYALQSHGTAYAWGVIMLKKWDSIGVRLFEARELISTIQIGVHDCLLVITATDVFFAFLAIHRLLQRQIL